MDSYNSGTNTRSESSESSLDLSDLLWLNKGVPESDRNMFIMGK